MTGRQKRLLSLLFSAAAALAFSLVFYAFNTPLGPSIGSDNAMYLTMGTALARGYAPYTQIFDHKGPLLFAVQCLPQALSGGYSTLFVFLQETLVLFCCLRVLAAVARETGAPEALLQLVYLALTCSLTGGGNLSEEYTNLPTLLGLLAALRCFGRRPDHQPRALFRPALLMGLCACCCFLMRANNALPLCLLAADLALGLACSRQFAALGACAAGFTCGLLCAFLPVLVWLMSRGAVSAAFYGAILHNFMYAGTGDGRSRLGMLLHDGYGQIALLCLLLACLGALALGRKRRPLLAFGFLCAAAGGLMAAFISHKFYDHYLMIAVPLAVTGAGLLLGMLAGKPRVLRGASLAAALLCVLWLSVKGVQTDAWRRQEAADLPQFTADAQALYARVPEAERDRFMAYRVEPRWYVVTGALPCMRFYFLQETLAEANPAVMDEIVQTFETRPPLWLVIYYDRPFSPPYDPRVAEIFRDRYDFVDAAGTYQLLRLKE